MQHLFNGFRRCRGIVRATRILLLVTMLAGMAVSTANAQHYEKLTEKVTVRLTHTDAAAVIQGIRQQSTYNFIFDPAQLQAVPVENIRFESRPLGEVLEWLHQNAGLSFSLNNRTIAVQKTTSSSGNSLPFTGRVLEAISNKPLSGATVKTASGKVVLTNTSGYFYLESGGLLTISYAGFQTRQVQASGDTITVTLQPANDNLGEVVVVGYGTQLKEKITGSIVNIDGKDLQQQQVSTFTEAMAGRLPGVQVSTTTGVPGAAPSIRVRGTGSITAGNEPLYVVDGFPLSETALSSLNMDDIASVSVLKDASATSIYGSRGSNGVVIITTKRGEAGKAKVSISSYYGVQEISKKIDLLSPDEYVQFAIDARNNGWTYLGGSADDPNSARSPLYQISPYLYDKDSWVLTDWQDAVFRKAPMADGQLSVSGGTDKVQYMLSGGYFQQNGVIRNSFFKRYSLRGNIDAHPLSWLHLSGSLATVLGKARLANDEGQFGDGVLGTLINSPGFYGQINPDGSYPSFKGFGYGVSEVINPMILINEDNKKNDKQRTLVNLSAEVQLLKGLTFKTAAGFDYNSSIINDYFNSYINDLPANPGHVRSETPATGSYSSQTDFNWLSENTLHYEVTLGGGHHLDALAGFTAQKATTENVSIQAVNFPNDLVTTLNAGQISSASTTQSEWSLLSYLARLNYSFSNRYFATATIRRDGSSRFGADNRWGLFPSLSAGWMVSNEPFFHAPWVSFLKVRASYGLAGNNDISNYGAIGLLSYQDYVIGGSLVSGITPSTLSNDALSWEKSEQTDLGIEAGFLQNRISVVLDLYQRVSRNLLLDVPVPSILGITNSLENIGKVRNRGLEAGITTRNLTGRLKWTTTLNFSLNRNMVLALGADGTPIISSTRGTSHITEVGKPIGNFFGYIFDGVYNTQEEIDKHAHLSTDQPGDVIVRDVSGDGAISTDDRTILGNYQPDFIYGLTNDLSFGPFDCSILLQGVQGAEIMDLGMRQSLSLTGRTNNLGMVRDRWRSAEEPGNGKIPKAIIDVYGVRRDASTLYMQNGSYLRIRTISLGYNFREKLIRRIGMSSARVYLTAQNPFTFTSYVGYNPEVSSYHSALTPGVDYFNYPLARTFSAGFNVTF